MKTISLLLLTFLPASCAQVEPKRELLPSVVITAVSEKSVEFEVRNDSSRVFFYLGWEEGKPLASSEVLQRERWYQSYITFCATGAEMFSLAPGASFKDSVPNMKQGPVRVGLSFMEQRDQDSGAWQSVNSELHEGRKPQ